MGNLAETFFNPEREGWLTKEGGKYKSKHRRWFILKDNILYYFKQPSASGQPSVSDYVINALVTLDHVIQDSELIGSIPLDNLSVRDISEVCSMITNSLRCVCVCAVLF